MKGLISIILPVYNREKYLQECIQSVHNQTYQNYEIIIVDDGSSDCSFEIATSLAEKDNRIKLLKTDHQGVSAARNVALDVAKGDFVFFLDSDDIIHPLLFETFVTKFECTDASIAGSLAPATNEKYWDKVLKRMNNDKGPADTTYQNHEETLQAVFTKQTPLGNIGGVMMRRDLIGDTRFRQDLFIGEDFYFIYQNLIKGASSIFLKQSWYYARWHKSNTSQDYDFTGFWTRFYRRKLVWESEEAFGRFEYADYQKISGFACYTLCLSMNNPKNAEVKKMQKVIKEYKKILLPPLSFKGKIAFYLSLYTPRTYLFVNRLTKKLKKLKKRLRIF